MRIQWNCKNMNRFISVGNVYFSKGFPQSNPASSKNKPFEWFSKKILEQSDFPSSILNKNLIMKRTVQVDAAREEEKD